MESGFPYKLPLLPLTPKKSGMRNKVFLAGFAVCAIVTLFAMLFFYPKPKPRPLISSLEQLNSPDYSITVMTATGGVEVAKRVFPKANLLYITGGVTDCAMQVINKKSDVFLYDSPSLDYVVANNPEMALFPQTAGQGHLVIGGPLKNAPLMEKINEFIRQFKADGTYDEMYNRWFVNKDPVMPDIPEPKNPVGILKVGTEGEAEPFNFFAKDGELIGFDVEMVERMCLHLNMKVEWHIISWNALILAAQSGKVDIMVAELDDMPENRATMSMSLDYIDSNFALLVRKERLDPKIFQDKAVEQFGALMNKSKVGYIKGSEQEKTVSSEYKEAKCVGFDNIAALIAAVEDKSIDVAYATEPDFIEFIQKSGNKYTLVPDPVGLRNTNLSARKGCLTTKNYAAKFYPGQQGLGLNQRPALESFDGKKIGALEKTPYGKFMHNKLVLALPIYFDDYAHQVKAVQTGKIDAFVADKKSALQLREEYPDLEIADGFISIETDVVTLTTEERQQQKAYKSDENYKDGLTLVYCKMGAHVEEEKETILESFASSFKRTLITDNRWKMLAQGLGMTLFITFFSAIIGTALGFFVCMVRRSHWNPAVICAKIFIRVIQGTPILVLLMVLYYVVFGQVEISGVTVAIIAFSINLAVYFAEMLRGGIEGIDPGQIEAAKAMGFTRFQRFRLITFPQVVRIVMPVYKGELVDLLKSTAIVGYIAIEDLTKMSDLIRSRTYEAFFPLILTSIIYLAIAYSIIYMLTFIEKRTDPKLRSRRLKGVVEQE